MDTGSRHWIALGGCGLALAAIAAGAYLTSAAPLASAGVETAVARMLHRALGTLAAIAALWQGVQATGAARKWLWATAFLTALPGGLLEGHLIPGVAGVVHAISASMLLSVMAAATVCGAPGPQEEQVPDEGRPPLITLAKVTWVGLLIQTALGALYRHHVVGLLSHVAGAMVVMGMVMYAGIAAFSTAGLPPAVKRPALTLLIVTGVQMLLGLGAYLYRIDYQEQATGQAAMLLFTVIHVAVGALTTACCALMGMQISRYVRPVPVAR